MCIDDVQRRVHTRVYGRAYVFLDQPRPVVRREHGPFRFHQPLAALAAHRAFTGLPRRVATGWIEAKQGGHGTAIAERPGPNRSGTVVPL